jgi:UDP-2,3-diacylglucosamine pyrophosphatase LpxH
MKSFDLTVPIKGDTLRLALISCIHIGHKCHDSKHFSEWMNDVILSDPDCRVIMLGDTIDNGTKGSPGASIYEQTKNPREQLEEAFEVLRPLAESRRILFWHESNHSYRTFKDTGFFTAEEWLSQKFGIPWAGWQALSRIRVKGRSGLQMYTIHSMHGSGGGTAMTSPVASTVKQAMIAEADIYVRGHHHRPMAMRQVRYCLDSRGRKDVREIVYAATGCFLSYDASYGEEHAYVPNAFGCAVVQLGVREKKVEAKI